VYYKTTKNLLGFRDSSLDRTKLTFLMWFSQFFGLLAFSREPMQEKGKEGGSPIWCAKSHDSQIWSSLVG
jgi:hypothetical protein